MLSDCPVRARVRDFSPFQALLHGASHLNSRRARASASAFRFFPEPGGAMAVAEQLCERRSGKVQVAT